MYRHEKTFLLDFILLSCNVLLILFNIIPEVKLVWLIIWSILCGLRLVVMIIHQIKWHKIYQLETEQLKQMMKNKREDDE